jgi:hypothetical protein
VATAIGLSLAGTLVVGVFPGPFLSLAIAAFSIR